MIFDIATAFLAGFLTSLSPCVFPLIPITLSIIKKEKGFFISLIYVLGMVITYTILGIIFAYFGLMLGSIMQNTYIVFALGLFFFIMALSLLDIFSITLPQKLYNAILKFSPQGYLGAFLMGAFSGLLATPCTGPVLAFILGLIAKKQDIRLGIALMISFSLGLGLLFLLLGSFSFLLRFIPKSGLWMNIAKYILAIAMFLVSFYYMSILFYDSKNIENNWHIISHKNTYEDLEKLLSANKPFLLDFYADWCALCLKLEKTTLKDYKVQEALSKFMLIKIDLTKSSDELEKVTKRFGITGLPVLILMPPDKRLYGYVTASELLEYLRQL